MDELREENGSYHEVIETLKGKGTLEKSIRKVALRIANARPWEDADDSKESVDGDNKE